MKKALCTLRSTSRYGQGKYVTSPKNPKEGHDAYDERTCRERMHVNAAGNLEIPPMAFKNCLSEAAKYLSIQIPGKGKATFTKHFESGVLVVDPLDTGIPASEVKIEALFVPTDGQRGGGKRAIKRFPFVESWSGQVEFVIVDDTVTEEVFERVLTEAGLFVGIGRFRPRNNGFYGRFKVEQIDWTVA